jgi:hypothetical protein
MEDAHCKIRDGLSNMATETYTTVCGGFPVLVRGTYSDGDWHTGEPQGYGDIEVLRRDGKAIPFMVRKMRDSDWDRMHVALEAADEGPDYDPADHLNFYA